MQAGEASETSQTVSFVDAVSLTEDVGYNKNDIVSAGASSATNLGEFLSRPTLINTTTWSTSDSVGIKQTLEPWYLLLNDAYILNKVKNFAYFRGKLCLKFIVNGTPFHFGMMRVAYEPNVNAANTGTRYSKIRTNPTTSYPLLTPYSQLPGIYIYPSANAGAELKLPFFLHKSWSKLTSAADVKTLGALSYFIATPLDVASTSASPTITIQTYAWMEEFELSGSTQELTLQAGDEYDGPVSLPASALARFSKTLEQIPIIGKYARATTIASSALAKVSSIFGFTNVPVIRDYIPMVPMPYSGLSTSEISAPVHKLTLDPKQELSIDPTLLNVGPEDEMVIKHIVSQETILHVFDWITTDASNKVLANFRVNPCLYDSVNILDGSSVKQATRVYHTYLSYLNFMFAHWRGDIIFDIEVVCSKFHKGRLQVSWDPLASTANAQKAANVTFTTIIDIGENNHASIRVPYHSAYEFLNTRSLGTHWTNGSTLAASETADNGILIISVLNPLVSPITPQEVHIVVKVRGADNFEFANPRSHLGDSAFAPPPTFFAVQSADVEDDVNLEPVEVTFGDIGSKHDHRYDMNFGERIVSLRALLRRYSVYDWTVHPASTATRLSRFVKSYSKNPPMYGFDPSGLDIATGLITVGSFYFNAVPTHPLSYVSMLYGAFRGGVNYTAVIGGGDGAIGVQDVKVERYTSTRAGNYSRGTQFALNSTDNVGVCRNTFIATPHATGGAALTNTLTNGAISWYYPMMTQNNFQYPDPYNAVVGNSVDGSNAECTLLEMWIPQSTANTKTLATTVTTYAAAGTDYTCIWLLCCPTLDYYVSAPYVTS